MIEPVVQRHLNETNDEPSLRLWRDAFIEATQSRLEMLDHEYARLNESARESSPAAYEVWRALGRTFHRQRQQAWDHLRQLYAGAPDDWPAVAAAVDQRRQDFAASLAQARTRLRSH